MSAKQDDYSSLPSVDTLITAAADHALPHPLKRLVARDIIETARARISKGQGGKGADVQREYLSTLKDIEQGLRPVINATGVVLHTGLGRAAIPAYVVEAFQTITDRYVNLELDLHSGQRGNRHDHLRPWIRGLSDAEDGILVNNNAAAVLLALNTFADRKEVVVSRGQQVEIGGSFRIPEIIKKAGAKLVEVGTTNRTHAKDYSNAISERTRILLWVHTSNYRVEGFTKEVDLSEMVGIARDHGLLVMADLGSGALTDLEALGLKREPLVAEIIGQGVDLVTFSVDKLLGGPQGGIICGKRELIRKLEKNNLLRALRPDKVQILMTQQALSAYAHPDELSQRLPTYRDFQTSITELKKRAEAIIAAVINKNLTLSVVETESQVGSGASPTETIASMGLHLDHNKLSASRMASCLRTAKTPILGRIQEDAVILDLRTVRTDEDESISSVLTTL